MLSRNCLSFLLGGKIFKERHSFWGEYGRESSVRSILLFSEAMSTVGAEAEIRVNGSLATRASPFPGFRPEIHPFASFIDNGMAILTDQKRSPLFDRKKRNEEEAQIVVNPFTENLYLLTG